MRNHDRLICMGVRDAEMTKYAANAMLATRISFMNEIANLCDRLGVDVENVRKGIGSDSRIGYSFIYPGCGYGGSCFPKDVKALVQSSRACDFEPSLLQAVEARNERQKRVLFDTVVAHFGADLSGRRFGVWGLSFKPNTDDMREAPSLVLIEQLLAAGARVAAYDPVAGNDGHAGMPREWLESGRVELQQVSVRRAARSRRDDPGHRMETLPPARFRRHARPAAHAGDLRRPQPVRPGADERLWFHLLRYRAYQCSGRVMCWILGRGHGPLLQQWHRPS